MVYLTNLLCIFSFWTTFLTIQAGLPEIDFNEKVQPYNTYYMNCSTPVTCNENSKYRTINGSCNNLKNPLWGSTGTPYLRLAPANYADGVYRIRNQVDGTKLPGPRELQLKLFLFRSRDIPANYNYHVNQLGQWIAHDIAFTPPDLTGPSKCCDVQTDENIPTQCQTIIEIPSDDPVYSEIGQTCMEFRRVETATNNFNCTVTPQIAMNQAPSFIDASQLYGRTTDLANEIRTFINGKLVTDIINGNEFCPLFKRNGSLLCTGRDNVDVCFSGAGDPRINQHLGITLYETMFVRFHNFMVDILQNLIPEMTDEDLYQEVRRFIIAANQIMVYRDYLPILLGKEYTKNVNLAFEKDERTMYDPTLMPQLSIEFAAGAFRVPHNMLPSKYNFIGKNNEMLDSVNLNEWMSNSEPIIENSNFDDLVRGMTQSSGRSPTPSYNYLISNFMFRHFLSGNADLLSVDIQRGRDTGVPTYNTMREMCGFSKALTFQDFGDFIPIPDILKLNESYATVDDVDLIVGALLEVPCPDAMVGPTARCILADVFYRLRYGDRFFYNVEGQPGSFSKEQLEALWNIDLGHIICAGSGMDEIPVDIYEAMTSGYSKTRDCKTHLSNLDLNAWITPDEFNDYESTKNKRYQEIKIEL